MTESRVYETEGRSPPARIRSPRPLNVAVSRALPSRGNGERVGDREPLHAQKSGYLGSGNQNVWKSDTPSACSECGDLLTLDTWGGFCIVCHQVFCRRHVLIRHGVSNCAACDVARRSREDLISEADADRVLRLLVHDLVDTIGRGQEPVVEEAVARIRIFTDDPADFEQRVVNDVQQCLHDAFVDTSWPACPEHPNHPLWYSEGWWRCERSGTRVAPLGELRRRAG